MKYYLIKTEPDVYSIDRFAEDKVTSWNGVRNPQAVIFLKAMNPGDLCLVYHTQGISSIVGLAEVIGNLRRDPNDPKSWLVDMKYLKTFQPPYISIKNIKEANKFTHFRLVRQSRLSVMDVPPDVIEYLKQQGLPLP